MYSLISSAQNYTWGKKGKSSLVGKLYQLNGKLINDEPYAELWMGTHKKCPSLIKIKDELIPLYTYIDSQLPYLFKVLSVNKALSIQAHPDKELAKKLHLNDPEHYPDDNHKPEMAIALTKFEMLCQFRDLNEIKTNLNEVFEFRMLIQDQTSLLKFIKNPTKILLKKIFKSFIECPSYLLEMNILSLQNRLKEKNEKTQLEKLIMLLIQEYNNDIGVFCPYFMNYITLNPGESIFINANEPHAYLYGDCIECMACSDNVVRAGLTKKFVDKKVLCKMLTYNTDYPNIISGKEINDNITLYTPPVNEFRIEKINIEDNKLYNLSIQSTHSIILVLKGQGYIINDTDHIELTIGSIIYQKPNTLCKITCTNKWNSVIIYRVY